MGLDEPAVVGSLKAVKEDVKECMVWKRKKRRGRPRTRLCLYFSGMRADPV